MHLLAPPRHFDDVARITTEGVQQAIELARSAFPYVLVDLDHSFRPEQAEVLRRSDLVLLVLRLDFASLRNARRALEYLESPGHRPRTDQAGRQPPRPAQGDLAGQGRGGPGHEGVSPRPR